MKPKRKKLFHGTLKNKKDSIIQNGYTCSDRSDNYLGTGVYFYDEENLALTWAQKKARYYSNSPVVFEATVDYKRVLDLTDVKDSQKVETFVAEIEDSRLVIKKGDYRPRQLLAQLATIYINTYCEKFDVGIVKGCVFVGERVRLYQSGIITKTEIQYCVRNTALIVGNNLVYEVNEYGAV